MRRKEKILRSVTSLLLLLAAVPVCSASIVLVDSGQALGSSEGGGHIDMADLDGDADLDIFVTSSLQGSRIFLNDGTGILHDSGQSLGERGQKICLADLDCNNTIDAMVTHMEDGISIWLNDGTGVFSAADQGLGELNVTGICAGDVDGDGKQDIFIGKIDGFGGNMLFFNRTDVSARSSTWGKIKTMFDTVPRSRGRSQ